MRERPPAFRHAQCGLRAIAPGLPPADTRAHPNETSHEGDSMFVRWRWTMIAVAAALGLVCADARAQTDIETKAQACAACHGANGVPTDPKTIPNIWGQQQYYLFKQLVDYRLGLREHPIMTPLAKSLNHSDLRPLAAYFAAKPWP